MLGYLPLALGLLGLASYKPEAFGMRAAAPSGNALRKRGASAAANPAANAKRSTLPQGVARPQGPKPNPPPVPAPQDPAEQAAVNAAVHAAIKEEAARGNPAAMTPASPIDAAHDPTPDPWAQEQRTPKQAAAQLRVFLHATKRCGTKTDRPDEVKSAQADMRVKPVDGIVGPSTRAAAKKLGVTLPNR